MDKKYVIFDMDGTLVDSKGFWRGLIDEYLQSKGVLEISPEVRKKIKPMTLTESAALFAQEYGISGTAEEIAHEMKTVMEMHYRNDILLKQGAKEYLEKLKARGVRMCVVSVTAAYLMDLCMERLGYRDYFEFVLSCEDFGTDKQSPDIYHEAAKRLGCSPEETAVFEDAVYAARTAKTAGYYVAGVYDGQDAEKWAEMTALADELVINWHDME